MVVVNGEKQLHEESKERKKEERDGAQIGDGTPPSEVTRRERLPQKYRLRGVDTTSTTTTCSFRPCTQGWTTSSSLLRFPGPTRIN